MISNAAKVRIVSLKHPGQAPVLIAKWMCPYTTTDTADCFESSRDAIIGALLPGLSRKTAMGISEEVQSRGQRLLVTIQTGLRFEAEVNHPGLV